MVILPAAFIGNIERKIPFEKSRLTLKNIIKIYLKYERSNGMAWILRASDTQVAGFCGHGSEILVSVRRWKFIC